MSVREQFFLWMCASIGCGEGSRWLGGLVVPEIQFHSVPCVSFLWMVLRSSVSCRVGPCVGFHNRESIEVGRKLRSSRSLLASKNTNEPCRLSLSPVEYCRQILKVYSDMDHIARSYSP